MLGSLRCRALPKVPSHLSVSLHTGNTGFCHPDTDFTSRNVFIKSWQKFWEFTDSTNFPYKEPEGMILLTMLASIFQVSFISDVRRKPWQLPGRV